MATRGITAELVAGIAAELVLQRGRRVRAVHQDGPLRFRLELQGHGKRVDWVIDLEPAFPRTHLAEHRPAPPRPSALAHALRTHLAGAILQDASSVPGDRALAVRFRAEDGTHTVWVELFGGHANLYLVDEAGIVQLTPRGTIAGRRGAVQGSPFVPAEPRADAQGEAPRNASAEVLALLADWQGEREHGAARGRLTRFLRSQATRATRTIAKLEAHAAQASEAAEYQRRGELLQGAFHLLRPGLRTVRVPDYSVDPPVEVEVPLDADLAPGEQVAACFRKARRRRRGAEEARLRLPEQRERLRAIDEARDALAVAPDSDTVLEIAATLPEPLAGLARAALQVRPTSARARKAPRAAAGWHTFVSADGWRILVGRDARGNDRLTLTVAKPWDLFLHVRAASGSHVVVPTPRGKTVPKETLLDAAELACLYSERRESEHNEVDYVPRRHVRKPKGAAPGAVQVERAKTLPVRRDPARRERLQHDRKRLSADLDVT